MQPLAGSIADFEAGVQPLGVFDHRAVQIRHTHFQAVRHGKLVAIREQFIWKGRSYLKKLKAAEFVGMFHLRNNVAPAGEQRVGRRS